jgi:membrane protein implicated in regulation of membrane protease activity
MTPPGKRKTASRWRPIITAKHCRACTMAALLAVGLAYLLEGALHWEYGAFAIAACYFVMALAEALRPGDPGPGSSASDDLANDNQTA